MVPLPPADIDAYWRIRDRLVEDFAVVTDAQGGSVPATYRADDEGRMKWADATIQLGWYTGALAIEQALLAEPDAVPGFGRGTRTAEESAAELALALGAIDRLDDHPPSGFADCGGPWGLDGFFVRDDVPEGFQAHFDGISVLESDWVDPVVTNKEMSQDQVVHVFVGLALVARYTDPDLEVDDVRLRDRAIASMARIGGHVAGDGDWVIRNPGCDDRAVERGDQAQFYSTAIARTVEHFTGEAPADPLFTDAWEQATSADYPAYSNHNNLHMAMAVAATGDGWGEATGDVLVELAEVYGWDAYPALHLALWGGEDESGVEARLSAAVAELGEAEPASSWPKDAGHGWTTWHRYITPSTEHGSGEEGSTGRRYPGADFLLASMLDLAAFRADWPEDPGGDTAGESRDAPEAGCGCTAGGGLRVPFAAIALGLAGARRKGR